MPAAPPHARACRRALPLIPTHAAAASTASQQQQQQRGRLAAAVDLFDPRVPALVRLLDPARHFPGLPFDDAAAGGQLLDSLVVCGLQTQLSLQVRRQRSCVL